MPYTRFVSVFVMLVAAWGATATSSVGQESGRVREWTKKFVNIRSQLKKTAGAISQKVNDFNATAQAGRDPQEFFKQLQGLHEESRIQQQSLQAVLKEIHESRDELEREDYDIAYRDYQETYKVYQSTYREYQAAYDVYRTAQNESQAAKRKAYKTERENYQSRREAERATRSAAQTAKEEAKKRYASQLKEVSEDLNFRKDVEVIALRDASLMSGKDSVGTVKKGEKLTVERVQGEWLYVRNGWIYSKHVIAAPLMAWYQGLPDNFAAENAGRTNGKYYGFFFEIINAGAAPLNNAFLGGNTINGQPLPRGGGGYINCRNAGVFLAKVDDHRRELLVSFPGSKNIFPNVSALRSYGMVDEGDYIVISTNDRRILVNGDQRTSRGR